MKDKGDHCRSVVIYSDEIHIHEDHRRRASYWSDQRHLRKNNTLAGAISVDAVDVGTPLKKKKKKTPGSLGITEWGPTSMWERGRSPSRKVSQGKSQAKTLPGLTNWEEEQKKKKRELL